MKYFTRKLGSTLGFSLTEALIAILLMGLVSSSAYQFFVGTHQQTISQQHISDMQQTTRATLDELSHALKMAGFKVPAGSKSYVITGDSLYVFASLTQPVDTTLFYMADYASWELPNVGQFPQGMTPRKLMRKTNHADPGVFADYITSLSYRALDSVNIKIGLTVIAPLPDETYKRNSGYRVASDTAQVRVRNYRS